MDRHPKQNISYSGKYLCSPYVGLALGIITHFNDHREGKNFWGVTQLLVTQYNIVTQK